MSQDNKDNGTPLCYATVAEIIDELELRFADTCILITPKEIGIGRNLKGEDILGNALSLHNLGMKVIEEEERRRLQGD